MADVGTNYTDKKIAKLEKVIQRVYSEAQKDIEKKLDTFNRKFKVKNEIKLKDLKEGKITKSDYDSWLRGQIFQSNQWKAKQKQIVDTLYNANTISMKIVNNNMTDVFAVNANYQSYSLEHDAGVNFGFGLYDTETVAKLLKEEPTLLPFKYVNKERDNSWNQKKVTNCITQGIIQGEGLDQIAKRIASVTGSQNKNTMLTAARTAMTSAQNAGRMERLRDAKSMGIKVHQEWMATLDERTRDSHRNMDGEKIEVGDKWHPKKFSNGCRYPGDPEGPASETFNCRCTLVGDLDDFPSQYERYDNIEGKPIAGMTYKQWYEAKTTGKNVSRKGMVIGSTFKTITKYGTHWTSFTRESGYKFRNGETRDIDVFTLDNGTRVVYPYNLDETKQTLEYDVIVKKLYEISEDFRNVIQKEIQVVDFENPDDYYWRSVYKNFTRSYATGGDEIIFYADTYHDPDYVRDTLCHEGGHYLDNHFAKNISSSKEWTDAMNKDMELHGFQSVTEYGLNAAIEDFAESCMMYYSRDKETMEKQFPNRLKVVERVVKKYGNP